MKALLGEYPCTALFRQRAPLAFEDVKPPSAGFKRVVRNLEFDFAELAITTFLMAKAAGKPYRLLPAVVLARMQHPRLVCDRTRPVAPRALEGKRVAVRSYSVTTGMWIRGILAEDHGVDHRRITWVTFEEAHVAEFRDLLVYLGRVSRDALILGRLLDEFLLDHQARHGAALNRDFRLAAVFVLDSNDNRCQHDRGRGQHRCANPRCCRSMPPTGHGFFLAVRTMRTR